MKRLTVALLSACATAVVLATGAHSAPSPTQRKALEALAAARPRTAVAAVPSASGAGPQHRTPPAVTGDAVSHVASSAPAAPAQATTASAPAKATATATPTPTATPKPLTASKAKHVFVLALQGPGYQQTFGTESTGVYLTKTLRAKGAVLSGFAPLGDADLPNYIAFAGGQPPNGDTQKECASYDDFGSDASADKHGVIAADGCVYPNTLLSLGDQVSASGGIWRAYAEGMGDKPCVHPDDGAPDATTTATDGYVTRHNPWVYFHSLLDLGDCIADDVDLSQLQGDLKSASKTPELSVIEPDLCNSGGCADGLKTSDAFITTWVPRIQASPAYKKDGVLVIAFLSRTAGATGATGALVLSRYATPGSLYAKPLDPYGLLRSVEDLLGLKPLAKAQKAASFAHLALKRAFAG